MRIPLALLAAVLVVGSVVRADAAPITFDFTITFTTGVQSGLSYDGAFSVDGDDCTAPGGLCDGTFQPSGPLDLLSFDITVGGIAYDITKDIAYPNFPTVTLVNGIVTGVNFTGDSHLAVLTIATIFSPEVTFVTGEGFLSTGDFSAEAQSVPVPEPASLSLLGIGLAGLGARRWRQRRNS